MALDLRPLTLGELLDRSFSLYRTHFRTFVAIMAVPAVLGAAVGVLLAVIQSGQPRLTPGTDPTGSDIIRLIGSTIVLWTGTLFYLAIHVIAVGATTAAVSELYMGRDASAGGAYQRVRHRIGTLLFVLVQTTLRVAAIMAAPLLLAIVLSVMVARSARVAIGGFVTIGVLLAFIFVVLAVVLVVFVTLRYCLAVPAVVIESVTARESLRRSVELMQGNLWRGLVLGLFGVVVAQIATVVFQGPFIMAAFMAGPASRTAFWMRLLGTVTGALGNAISSPLMSVAVALLYYDARVRHEGLDLQIMMDSLDSPSVALTPPSAAL